MISLLVNYLTYKRVRMPNAYKQLFEESIYHTKLSKIYRKNLCNKNRILMAMKAAGYINSNNDQRQHSNNYLACCKDIGELTSIENGFGVINNTIIFDLELADDFTGDVIRCGAWIEYLYYTDPINSNVVVLKIERVLTQNEFETVPSAETDLFMHLEHFQRLPIPCEYESNVVGVIIEVKTTHVTIKTVYDHIRFAIDMMELDFTPEIGDCFTVLCLLRNTLDKKKATVYKKKILKVISVRPTRIIKNKKCMVQSIDKDFCILDTDIYLAFNNLQNKPNMNLGDTVLADIIESEQYEYKWRCINVMPIEDPKSLLPNKKSCHNMRKANDLMDAMPPKVYLQQGNIVTGTVGSYYNNMTCHKLSNIRNYDIIRCDKSDQMKRFKGHRKIPQYPVPQAIRCLYFTCSSENKSLRNYEYALPILTEELTFQNYIERLDTFINFEECENDLQFRNYDMEIAYFTPCGDYLCLEIPDLNDRRPRLCIGDSVLAINPFAVEEDSQDITFSAKIHKIVESRVYFKFNREFTRKYNKQCYRLEFIFSRFRYRKQKLGIRMAVKQFGEGMLFPTKIKLRHRKQLQIELNANRNLLMAGVIQSWFDKQLNDIQKRAIFNVLCGECYNMPYIIFGPPGTGKTKTLIELTLQVVHLQPNAHILISAPSNSAVILIATHLLRKSLFKNDDLIFIVGQNQMENGLVPEHLLPYAITFEFGLQDDSRQSKFLGKNRITIGTLATLGNLLLLTFPRHHFTHVFIDECGKASEPEVMQVICQVSRQHGHVVLLGDYCQLDDVVTNRYDNSARRLCSYLERLQSNPLYKCNLEKYSNTGGYNPLLITKLLNSYRGLPSIVNVYSRLFYQSELIPMTSNINSPNVQLLGKLAKILPKSTARTQRAHGVYFNGVDGMEYRSINSPSWFNPTEAKNILLMTNELYGNNIAADDIGIITMYNKQVRYISGLFRAAKIQPPKIGTAEEYQGQEREIILVSTVRTMHSFSDSNAAIAHTDFIYNAKRMNVVISRARTLLIVYGHTDFLCKDKNWQAFIQYCKDNDAYWDNDTKSFASHADNNLLTDNRTEQEQ